MTILPDVQSKNPETAALEALCHKLSQVRGEIAKQIYGQSEVIDLALTGLLAGGHLLLIGLPGLAKTRLVNTLGHVMGLDTKRIQCTPDLMPADILGSEILEETAAHGKAFRFVKGPIFTELLMADEINRASPRTQSALLQAMQEKVVTIAGETHALPQPFHVLATQNPIEQEGTYPLPEAQLDRFLLQIDVAYPDKDAEKQMLIMTTSATEATSNRVLTAQDLSAAQHLVRQIPVGEAVADGIVSLIRASRPESTTLPIVRQAVAWGAGPRAGQALMLCAKAKALMEGRLSPSLDDVISLAKPVLRHRMNLTFTAKAEGLTLDQVITELCQSIA